MNKKVTICKIIIPFFKTHVNLYEQKSKIMIHENNNTYENDKNET